MGHILDCLLRLSITIANLAPYNQFKSKADDSNFIDLPTQWDISHVKEKFPSLNDKIAERLGKAITFRCQYFKYREEHHKRFSKGIDGGGGVNEGVDMGVGTTVDDTGE
ncbi:hypothetical protein F4814DRAFT_457698 [Daldinia grandis]|nr:hypothetical protein F4814DRAFT_457698 [Daldinia grandis]